MDHSVKYKNMLSILSLLNSVNGSNLANSGANQFFLMGIVYMCLDEIELTPGKSTIRGSFGTHKL